MRKYYLSAIFLAFAALTIHVNAQTPQTEWAKCYVHTNFGLIQHTLKTSDGGYILTGPAFNQFSDLEDGETDGWITKVDKDGNTQWQKFYGGSADDHIEAIHQTSDGGYLAIGHTYSFNGDAIGNHGFADVWVLKLDALGNKEWSKTYGGSQYDWGSAICETPDNNFIIAAITSSNNGDVATAYGSNDCWVIKIDLQGNIIWENTIGTVLGESGESIVSTKDGGCIVAGYAQHATQYSKVDFYVIKLNNNGQVEWENKYGGSQLERSYAIKQTKDDGYIVVGEAASSDGNLSVNPTHTNSADFWILKLNQLGTIQWQRVFGGSKSDAAKDVVEDSFGNFIVVGNSQSIDGDIIEYYGSSDIRVIKLSSTGTLLWQKAYGGTEGDFASTINIDPNNAEIIVGGYTTSKDFDAIENQAYISPIAIKLAFPQPIITVPPPINTIACANENISLVCQATNANTYQWQKQATNGNWENVTDNSNTISGSQTTSLHFTPASMQYTGQYRCIIGNDYTSDTSEAVDLIINPLAQINQQPTDITVPEGQDAQFTVTAQGANLIYQWQQNIQGEWQDIPAATSPTLQIAAASREFNKTQYRCIVVGECNQLVTVPTTLTVAFFYIPTIIPPGGNWNLPFLENYPGAVVSVYDAIGRKVYQSSNSVESWNTSFFAAGTYFYRIDFKNGKKITGKLLIIRP